MLIPIKPFYVHLVPSYEEWKEAINIAKTEKCVVEVRWMPNRWAGWYHEYVFEDSDPATLDANVPKVYGV